MKNFDSLARFLKKIRIPYPVIFIVTGLLTTIWFLIRVIPKPARAGYPCMRVAAPFMSSFVLYLISIATTAFAFKKSRGYFAKSKHAIAGVCLAVAVVTAFAVNFIDVKPVSAGQASADKSEFPANEPMGTGRGIFPGRVVWAHDKNATDENFETAAGKHFWNEGVADQTVVSAMLQNTVKKLTGKADLKEAWDGLFKYHNKKKYKTSAGYSSGQQIFIKINQGCTWALPYPFDIDAIDYNNDHRGVTEATPQVVLELLYQLIEIAGVPEENIFIGDPGKHIYKHNMDAWSSVYPNVNYICETAAGGLMQKSSPTDDPVMNYSDNKRVMPEAKGYLYYEITDADYMINVANLKLHTRNGISLTAKNHFGSQREKYAVGADKVHPGTLQGDISASRLGWGEYRVLVDIMGNEYLGGNTMLFIVDGLFGGGASETKRPVKYLSSPFDNDWANSIFVSQDEVALESVCQDILREEWNGVRKHASYNSENENSPWWAGVADHLHQAADSENWPLELFYIDNNGTLKTSDDFETSEPFEGYKPNLDSDKLIGSLGTHEHWNNPIDKQYSRNLGLDKGIELIMVEAPISTSGYTAYKVAEEHTPVIDGIEDNIWEEADWYAIGNVWLPYNNVANSNDPDKNHKVWDGPSDFTGKFKMLWSEDKNVLYFLAEIIDDKFIDGYVSGGDYPNFDVLELFIDENKSKGNHLFNSGSTLASNAFAYHILVDALEGEAQTEFKAMDLVGTDWGNTWNPDYSDHFEEFSMIRTGTKSVYEFALRIYNDQYDIAKTKTAADNANCIVTLTDNKQLGFTVAYCDNDDKDNQRDHFFGSATVSQANRNESWQNADPFGTLTLSPKFVTPVVIDIEDTYVSPKKEKIVSIYPNPATDFINLAIDESYSGQIKIDLYSITGALVAPLYRGEATSSLQLSLPGLPSGNYICIITTNNGIESTQILIK